MGKQPAADGIGGEDNLALQRRSCSGRSAGEHEQVGAGAETLAFLHSEWRKMRHSSGFQGWECKQRRTDRRVAAKQRRDIEDIDLPRCRECEQERQYEDLAVRVKKLSDNVLSQAGVAEDVESPGCCGGGRE